jgi:hypothetical protein
VLKVTLDLYHHLKAVKLSLKKKNSQRNIANTLEIRKKQVRNALKAYKEKKKLERNRKLSTSSKNNKKKLITWVNDKANKATPVSYKQFKDKVCIFFIS